MKGILLVLNLGLGDAIIMNAVIRDLARRYELVCVPAKHHNVSSIAFMLRDLPNVVVRPVIDHDDMMFFAEHVWTGEVLRTGISGQNFIPADWDQCFYRQAGISFQRRWDDWKFERPANIEDQWPTSPVNFGEREFVFDSLPDYAFVHNDPTRGFAIQSERIGMHPRDWVYPFRDKHIFQWVRLAAEAIECHCISSSFALLIDSLPPNANQKLFLHAYARPGEPLPTFRHNWTILK